MMAIKSNLKGFVFTLDAFFALIVAVASVSILMYVHFSSTLLYTAPSAEASSILQNLLQTSVLTASSGNLYASYLLNGWNGNAYSWPQFSHDQYHSSNTSYGPKAGYLLYIFKAANTITPVVAVDRGIAAFAAGFHLYAINATNGGVVSTYPLISAATIPVAPVIYKNEIIYATSGGYINAVSVSNSFVQLWSRSMGAAATTPLQIENNYLVFGISNSIYLLNPANGTTAATVALPVSSQAQPPAYVNGEFIISTGSAGTQNYVYSYALTTGGTLTNVWSYTLTTSQTSQPVVNGTAIAVGSGSALYVLTLGGSLIKQNTLPNAQIVGVASSTNNFCVETVNAIYSFSPSGNTIFSYPTQADSQNSVPSISLPMLYTLVSGTNFQGYNLQTGMNVWNITLPSASSYTGYSNIALAYGNAYVPNGNTLYVFGTYEAQPGDSLLQSIAGMYMNNQSAYANLMLNRIYNSTNTGIFINSTYAPSLETASFRGQSAVVTAPISVTAIPPSQGTVSIWINKMWANNDGATHGVLGLGGYYSAPGDSADYNSFQIFKWSGNGNWIFRIWSPSSACDINIPDSAISGNTWHQITSEWGNSISGLKVWIDGSAPQTCSQSSFPANWALNTLYMGEGYGNTFMNGFMADVQIYNTALKPSQVMQLYQMGMYGIPPNMTNLVGWWPLNGDFNDYSGHYNLGTPTNVVYQNSNTLPLSLKNAFQISKATAPLSITSNGVGRFYNVSVVSWR